MAISDFYGKIDKCNCCTNSKPDEPMPCNACFCRGYVAECLSCRGTGQKTEAVAGGAGEMRVTCNACGGKAKFAVNKPADWDILHPAVEEVAAETEKTAEQLAAA